MLTSLGKFLRKLRIDRGEYLKDMADKLDVTVSFLSAVENGNKRMPSAWNSRICKLYKLDNGQIEEFTKAIAESEKKLEMNLAEANDQNRFLAISFARKFTDFDDRKVEQLIRLLREEK